MLRERIREDLQRAIVAAQADGSLPAFEMPPVEISRPKQAEHGDYSTNLAMVAAASIRKAGGGKANPRMIAQSIVDHLQTGELYGEVTLAGPGFINLRLANSWLQKQVSAIVAAGASFGDIDRGKGARWQVEYVSANPTGPIHYGGARNAVLGDTLSNVLEAAGYNVQREYYVNDGGSQFRLFVATLYAQYARLLGVNEPIPEDGYAGAYMIEYAQQIVDSEGDRLLKLERPEAMGELSKIGRAMVLEALEKELQRIGVEFDNWFSEQSLYDDGEVEQALEELESRGQLASREGAVWFLASDYPKNNKDEVVIRSNGAPTYFAADIAYHYDKFVRRKFEHVINVWAVDHQGHVPRMAAVMEAFGLDPDRLTILMYDLVKLVRDGQEVKLSKRSGNLLTINDVVDEVGADALRFNLLTRSPESTIEFDLDLAVTQSNENPVYYVQYSHARICSILQKAAAEGLLTPVGARSREMDLQLLEHPAELTLIRKLLELGEQVDLAVDRLSPHNLTHYAIELAKVFNAFYRDCKVVDAGQPELSQARLGLAEASRIVLAKTLTLIGVGAPESM